MTQVDSTNRSELGSNHGQHTRLDVEIHDRCPNWIALSDCNMLWTVTMLPLIRARSVGGEATDILVPQAAQVCWDGFWFYVQQRGNAAC